AHGPGPKRESRCGPGAAAGASAGIKPSAPSGASHSGTETALDCLGADPCLPRIVRETADRRDRTTPDSPNTNCTTKESALAKRLTILGFQRIGSCSTRDCPSGLSPQANSVPAAIPGGPGKTSQFPTNIKLMTSWRFAEIERFRRSDQQNFILPAR